MLFSNNDGKSADYSHDHKINPPSIFTDDGGRSCGPGEWTCDSGQCINLSYHCDGNYYNGTANWASDCADSSDEIAETCCNGDYDAYSEAAICDGGDGDGGDDGSADDGGDDVCEDEYYLGEDAGYILGTSAGDINLDGNLNVTDIIMYIEKILED